MYKKFLTELKHSIKERGFVEGKDYISVDTDKYFILMPFVFEILQPFNIYDGKIPVLTHCLTHKKKYFKHYYEQQFLESGRLKCFFFYKSAKFTDILYPFVDREIRKVTLWEFTCWLDENDNRIHLFHNYYNNFNSCDSDVKIYDKASSIIKALKPIIFKEAKKYNLIKIREEISTYLNS